MTDDILSLISGGGWTLLAGWVFPAGGFVAVFSLLIFRHIGLIWTPLGKMAAAERGIVLALAAAGIGIFLNALQTPLYRLLEGYLLPERVRTGMAARHRDRKHQLEDQLNDIANQAETDATAAMTQARWTEQLSRYPADDRQVLATRLGNAIRAFETYGYDRFELDSQRLWTELCAQVPDALRTELDRARASVDFCVSAVYLSVGFGLFAAILGIVDGHGHAAVVLAGVVSVITTPLWYGLAVISTAQWQSTVQALVNLGRLPLAEAWATSISLRDAPSLSVTTPIRSSPDSSRFRLGRNRNESGAGGETKQSPGPAPLSPGHPPESGRSI